MFFAPIDKKFCAYLLLTKPLASAKSAIYDIHLFITTLYGRFATI